MSCRRPLRCATTDSDPVGRVVVDKKEYVMKKKEYL